jgi:predicted chitinase
VTVKVLPYDRSIVPQEQPWDCGPASAQVVLNSRGIIASETDLIREIGTTVNGTDYVGLIERVLDVRVPDARYTSVYIDHDPATPGEKEALWRNLVRSIDAGYGVVMNWVSPPGNHPIGIKGSETPNYRGTIYHYVPAMGYDDNPAQRAVWIADPGFRPFGYWVSFDQCASLIPPKGYAFADVSVPAAQVAAPVDDGADVLARAMGGQVSFDRYRQLLPAGRAALIESECNTVDRIAMWCAQVGHESGGLRWMEEIASGDAYDTRTDLGNTPQVDGDGRLYKGRGPIQVTGKSNYRALSIWAHDRGLVPTPTFFVDNPTELASDRYGFTGAIWYWTAARPMNSYADRGDIVGATRAVNGGTNGLDDRTARWNRCRAMGRQLLQLATPSADPLEELLMLSLKSMSIYADPGEPDVPATVMLQALDAHGPHEPWVEAQARAGNARELARVVRTALGKGQFGDEPRAVNQAIRVLAEIDGKSFDEMKQMIGKGALS